MKLFTLCGGGKGGRGREISCHFLHFYKQLDIMKHIESCFIFVLQAASLSLAILATFAYLFIAIESRGAVVLLCAHMDALGQHQSAHSWNTVCTSSALHIELLISSIM